MVDAVIDLVLNELYQVVTEEASLLRGVKQEIEKLREELKMMKAFLRWANDQKEKDPRLVSWVEQVRDVAFEIEDVVDDYVLRVAHGDGADTGDAHNTCLGRICSLFRKLKGKHQIGSELPNIKEKAKEIAERPKRYGYDLSQVNLHEQGSSSRLEIEQFRRNSAALVDESKLVGIDETKKELVDLLNDGDMHLKVVAIVGMGGLGKTALARQIYREMSRFQRRAFVTVSQTLNEEDFVKDMMQQLFPKEMSEMQNLPIQLLKERMKERLRDESYLIVVDDVWEIIHWDQIKVLFPINKHRSRVVVTTRMQPVANYSTSEYKGVVYPLQPLSNDASWELFRKQTFPTTQTCPSNLVDMCQDIVFKKCMGVPIAILAISGLLRSKGEHQHVDLVKNLRHSLGIIELKDNKKLEMTIKILSLSFDDLPDELKPCYMYLSIFPEDYYIEWKRVIRLWISEGFVAKRNRRTVEEDANSYLWELVNRNLIQIAQTKEDGTRRPESFRIHDFLREIVLSKSKQERFVEVMSMAEEMEIMEMRARRLSFHDDHDALKRLSQPLPIRSLVMFFQLTGEDAKLANDGFKLRLLGVLDLERAPLDSFPEEICTLLLLRYLSLSNTGVSNIPDSIGNLARLETLDLQNTLIAELPEQISMLQKLRHLLIYNSIWDGTKVTANIGGLVWLQELWNIEVPEKSEWMKGLGSLSQLRTLGLFNLKAQHWRELCSSISRLTKLRLLRLITEKRFELEYLRSPPAGLEELYLHGKLEELPSWMSPSYIRNLQVLSLSNTRLKKDPGATLGSFPNLAALFLWDGALDDGVKMRVLLPASFPTLKLFYSFPLTIESEGVIDEVTWKRAISDPNSEGFIGVDIVIPLT